jgi:putative membrane protein
MSYLQDPRVFWAAERTLLAWVRSGIGVISLGFVVAKFSLFLEFVVHDFRPWKAQVLIYLGTAMVVLGACVCALAGRQFRNFTRALEPIEIPPRWSQTLPLVFSWTFAVCGLLLAAYLVL